MTTNNTWTLTGLNKLETAFLNDVIATAADNERDSQGHYEDVLIASADALAERWTATPEGTLTVQGFGELEVLLRYVGSCRDGEYTGDEEIAGLEPDKPWPPESYERFIVLHRRIAAAALSAFRNCRSSRRLTPRARKTLIRSGLQTVGEVTREKLEDLAIRNCGEVTINEIVRWAARQDPKADLRQAMQRSMEEEEG